MTEGFFRFALKYKYESIQLPISVMPPFRDLGNIAAMGVVLAFLLSVTFLPAMMMLLPIKALKGDTIGSTAMLHFGEFMIRHNEHRRHVRPYWQP